MSDRTPLLPGGAGPTVSPQTKRRAGILTSILIPLLLIAGVVYVSVRGDGVPKDPLGKARYWMKGSPVIDGHIDLPILVREFYSNNINKVDLNSRLPAHYDTPRAREGRLGGFFWSIFTECQAELEGPDFLTPSYGVRDALEQIDVSINLIEKYSDDYALCRTADDVEAAIRAGKIASLMGLEGAHSIGNSIGVLRMLHQLGIRYMTLTHGCNNAFADSGGIYEVVPPTWNGLSPLGKELVKEMNRLGVLIDLSHVSEKTAADALALTKAPVIFSHSDAKHFNNITRNAPDAILDKIGREKGKVDGVIMVNFYTNFLTPSKSANVKTVADHIDYIGDRIGRHHVGIGSDFDGIEATPEGLGDVSAYPHLFAELIERGWDKQDLSRLAGGNLLRVMRGMEEVSAKLRKAHGPNMAIYSKRGDLGNHKTG